MPRLPRLTIVHLMKLVAYAAAAMGIIGPMVRIQEATGGPMSAVLLFGAVSVPLVWAGLSFILIRRGPARDRLIVALLLGAVSAALVVGLRFLWILAWASRGGGRVFTDLAITLVVVLLLAASSVFLAGRLLGRSRPCERPRAITERTTSPQASPR